MAATQRQQITVLSHTSQITDWNNVEIVAQVCKLEQNLCNKVVWELWGSYMQAESKDELSKAK